MAPPPVTPSPHRFIVKKEAPARRFALSRQPQFQQSTPRPSSQQQFNTTPRFNFSSTQRLIPTPSQSLPRNTPSAARYLTPAPKESDAIIDSNDLPSDIHEFIEKDGQDIDNDDHEFSDDGQEYNIEERSTKRRRLSVSSIISYDEADIQLRDEDQDLKLDDIQQEQHPGSSSSLPILSSPQIPTPKRHAITAPKFLAPTPAPPSTPLAPLQGATTFHKAPRFRPPDPAEAAKAGHDPLPEHFSPNRRGQKYVPDGIAAEVRDWLFNLDSAVATRPRTGEKSEWLVRFVVDEISGGSKTGFTMVRGRQIPAMNGDEGMGMVDTVGEVKVLLAGEGQAIGLQKGSPIEVGKRVGIKGPVWEVVVDGDKWGVGVDWKVLS